MTVKLVLESGEFSTYPSRWRIKEENGHYLFRCLSGAIEYRGLRTGTEIKFR